MTKGKAIRGWIILIICIVLIILVLPYAWWTSSVDYENIKSRGKLGTGKIIEVTGLKENHTKIEYNIDNQKFIIIRDAPSLSKKNIGENVKILYDSLDYANVLVFW